MSFLSFFLFFALSLPCYTSSTLTVASRSGSVYLFFSMSPLFFLRRRETNRSRALNELKKKQRDHEGQSENAYRVFLFFLSPRSFSSWSVLLSHWPSTSFHLDVALSVSLRTSFFVASLSSLPLYTPPLSHSLFSLFSLLVHHHSPRWHALSRSVRAL